MSSPSERESISAEAIFIGYAMSRLDVDFRAARGHANWSQCYQEAADRYGIPASSFNHLRDEFDPVHPNARRGRRNRPMRESRRAVLRIGLGMDDKALLALVDQLLRPGSRMASLADSLVGDDFSSRAETGAFQRRLETGLAAEEWFLENTRDIIGRSPVEILDCRRLGCGFDFGLRKDPATVYEVKGLRERGGRILLTEREWAEAVSRGKYYSLVVVSLLPSGNRAKIIGDPHRELSVETRFRKTVRVEYHAHVEVC